MSGTLIPPQDKVAVRVITIGVVTAMLFSVIGVFFLIWTKHDPKDLLPIATGALGAATGFLARTSTENSGGLSDPLPVVVPPSQPPIPVEPVSPGGDPTPLPPAVDPSGGGGDPIVVDGGGDESGGVPVAGRLRAPRRGGSRG